MKRFAFKMYLKKGCEKEYAKRHAAIWPELKQMIKDQGVSDYSIFWDKDTNLLFAVQKCDSDTNSQDTTNVDPITQKWWDMMADIMEVNPDNSPVSIPLEELFHMDYSHIYIAQIWFTYLGTRCPSREQQLLVSCSSVPHHVSPEGPLEGHGRLTAYNNKPRTFHNVWGSSSLLLKSKF